MSVLGWTTEDTCLEEGYDEIHCGSLKLISIDQCLTSPRAVAQRQISLALSLDAFLPTAPRAQMSQAEAADLMRDAHDTLTLQLEEVRGNVQICAMITHDGACNSISRAESWLKDRARARAAELQWQQQTVDLLMRAARRVSPVAVKVRHQQRGVVADILSKRLDLQRTVSALRENVSRTPAAGRCSLVGPLPAYGFVSLSESVQ